MIEQTNEILSEHIAGQSVRKIAAHRPMSHETARQIVIAEGTKFVNGIELDLMVAEKYDLDGRADEAQWPTLLVPNQDQDGCTASLRLLEYTLNALRNRGVSTRIFSTELENGIVIQIRTTTTGA